RPLRARRPRHFSLSCGAGHLSLHSFPTRRSSDLYALDQHLNGAPHPLLVLLAADPILHLDQVIDALSLDVFGHLLLKARGRRAEDRKSTRLNSSHVKISYAVFCLKKKKYSDVNTN